ncbi:unnamed protein product, partial [Prorocentrum cordatum]
EWTKVARTAFSQGPSGVVLVLSLLIFVLVTHLVVMNLVAGFFIENVLDIAKVEDLRKKLEILKSYRERVWDLFGCDSESTSSVLTWDELLEPAPPGRDGGLLNVLKQSVHEPLARRMSFSSLGSDDSARLPATVSKMELAARYTSVSRDDIKDMFDCLDIRGDGTVDRAEFARELGAAADDPTAWRIEELKAKMAKARSRTRYLAQQLEVVEADACSLAEARVLARASDSYAQDPKLASQTLEPDLEQLRTEALAHIRETEDGPATTG